MDYLPSPAKLTPEAILRRAIGSVPSSAPEPADVWPIITKAAYVSLGEVLATSYSLCARLSTRGPADIEGMKLVFICQLYSLLEEHDNPNDWNEFAESACALAASKGISATPHEVRNILATIRLHHFIFSPTEAANLYDRINSVIPNTSHQDTIAEVFGHFFTFEANVLLNQRVIK